MKTKIFKSILCFFVLISSGTSSGQVDLEVSAATRAALGIKVSEINSPDLFTGITTSALVIPHPKHTRPVMSPFEGVLLRPTVVPGMVVQEGQEVAILQSTEYTAALAELKTKRLAAEHDKHIADRYKELYKIGLRSAQELEEAEHEAEVTRLALVAAQNQLYGVHANADKTSDNSFTLTAPIGGVVSHIDVEAGGMVSITSPLMTVFSGEEYWARAQVPERLVNLLNVGEPVGLSNSEYKGRVIAIDPEINKVTRSIQVLVALPKNETWRLGQQVEIRFETSTTENALSIPAQALIRIQGQELVFIETESGFRTADVIVLARSRDHIVVTSDLALSDKVAVSGLAALKNMVEGG